MLALVLETAVPDTRHGLPAALPMFVLAAQGAATAWEHYRAWRGRRLSTN